MGVGKTMFSDLRQFLSHLESIGELKRIKVPVDPKLEMTEICDRTLRAEGPALLFENPKGYSIPVLIALFVGIAMTFVANRTRFGRYVYAIGGNPEAAELAGINTKKITLMVFSLMGMLAAIGRASCRERVCQYV